MPDNPLMSPNGICYKLEESPFFVDNGDLRFYFSSTFYVDKFTRKIDEFITVQRANSTYKLKMDILGDNVLGLSHYLYIEKRGFYATTLDGVTKFKDYLQVMKYLAEHNLAFRGG